MFTVIKQADKKIWCLFVAFMVIQAVILVIANPVQMMNDAVSYVRLAKYAAEIGSMYPTQQDICSDYLFAPGYVNWLAWWFAMGFSEKAPMAMNVLFNGMLFWEIYYLGVKFWTKPVANRAVMLFSLSVTTYASPLCLLTELMFTALGTLALCLACSGKRKKMVLAGFLLAWANWIRPLGILYIVVIFLLKYLRAANVRYLKSLLLSCTVTALMIGSVTYMHSGFFAFQSSTFGVNLIGSANEYAKGNTSTGFKILREGERGYIADKTMTFKDRDRFWRDLAIDWIKENPEKYFGLMPVKLARLHGVEIGFLDTFTGKDGVIQNPEYMKNIVREFPHWNILQGVTAYNMVLYMATMLLFVFAACGIVKRKDRGGIAMLAFWLLGTAATLPFPCSSRYHFPYMVTVFLLAAVMLVNLCRRVDVD